MKEPCNVSKCFKTFYSSLNFSNSFNLPKWLEQFSSFNCYNIADLFYHLIVGLACGHFSNSFQALISTFYSPEHFSSFMSKLIATFLLGYQPHFS